ncbi:MAG TPA: apolipoprotein N-acyltransferase [Verrucomicrobiae bacterium]|jgi:apolipoprotein N-acyltransferase|nr:apolipoprotein N-acyltransferase [Verrucomicrobiae bacterium]
MNFSWHTRVPLAIASGAALALSFPNYNFSLLAWVAVGWLVLASLGAPPAEAPLYGFLHGLVFYPLCLPWIDTVMRQYGNVDPWSAAGILGLLTIVLALATAFFSWSIAFTSSKGGRLACLLAPFLWVALEFLRSHLPIVSFPWNLAGYAASGNLPLVQVTVLTGIYGLSFIIVAYSSVIVHAILAGTERAWKTALAFTAVLILISAGGNYFVPVETPHHTARLVQTNFPQSEQYPANWFEMHTDELEQLERISVKAAPEPPRLIIWPEVPAPFSFADPKFAQRAARIARESGADFLVGVVDWKRDAAGKWLASNSAVLLDPSGQRIFSYDKIHLVPFGEYVPLRRWLSFAGRLTADISDFTPGWDSRVGRLPGGRFGTFICYEAVFPAEIRQFTVGGAELLINISNDGWFGRSSAPAQHLMMARVRAVENRRWLLRDTNNGFTVVVDPYGRIVRRLPTDVRRELDAPYDFRSGLTPYARFGDWFAWLCVIATVAIMARAALTQSRATPIGSTEGGTRQRI